VILFIYQDDKILKNKGKEKDGDEDGELEKELFGSESESDEFNEDDEDDEVFEEVPLDIQINKKEKQTKESNANVISTDSSYNKIFNIDYSNYEDIEKDPTVLNIKQFKSEYLKLEENQNNNE